MSTQADAPGITSFTAEQLVRVARLFAHDDALAHRFELPSGEMVRRRVSLAQTAHLQMWAILWPPGYLTEWHDHGAARGAFVVVRGALVEEVWTPSGVIESTSYGPDEHRTVEPGLVHRTGALTDEPALSVHAYAPCLDGARSYDIVDGQLLASAV